MAIQTEVEQKEQIIHSLEQQLQKTQAAEREAILEVNECGETIRHLQLKMASLQSAQDSANQAVLSKEHINNDLYQECETLKLMLKENQYKMDKCEEKVNALTLENGMLKSKLQEKTKETQKLDHHILKQKEALSRASESLKDTKKAAGNKMHEKESKLGVLQKELVQAQSLYSACYEELLHRENLLQKLKEETVQLTEQIKQQSLDINKLNSERKKRELDLVVVMEKHRTAQQEVSNRDQTILQLKTDLKTAQQKYLGSQEEASITVLIINTRMMLSKNPLTARLEEFHSPSTVWNIPDFIFEDYSSNCVILSAVDRTTLLVFIFIVGGSLPLCWTAISFLAISSRTLSMALTGLLVFPYHK
nr:PREDICTED: early endosome antigen 1-like [Latimeria chalumnae]|eukprot:XP_014344745.1 PREDICTED: early endosome antigen 1-like [Latimeria chalumnae]